MTREPHVPAPLFDRLVENGRRTLDPDGLRQSLRRELELLFNTRSTFPAQRLAGAPLTVIDYGIPSLADFSSRNLRDHEELAAALRIAVETFEPRLAAVRVRVIPPAEDQMFLKFALEAEPANGAVREVLSFTIDVDPQQERVTIDVRA